MISFERQLEKNSDAYKKAKIINEELTDEINIKTFEENKSLFEKAKLLKERIREDIKRKVININN